MYTGIETSIQPYEVMALFILIIGYIPIVMNFRQWRDRWIFGAYTALLIGTIATNLEAVVAPVLLNYVEQVVGVMLSGILFAVCAHRSHRLFDAETTPEEEYRKQ